MTTNSIQEKAESKARSLGREAASDLVTFLVWQFRCVAILCTSENCCRLTDDDNAQFGSFLGDKWERQCAMTCQMRSPRRPSDFQPAWWTIDISWQPRHQEIEVKLVMAVQKCRHRMQWRWPVSILSGKAAWCFFIKSKICESFGLLIGASCLHFVEWKILCTLYLHPI